jgi:hypothetical protein
MLDAGQLPEAGIKRCLKFLHEFAIPVLEVVCPLIHHVEIELIILLRDRAEVGVLLRFADNWGEEIHAIRSLLT